MTQGFFGYIIGKKKRIMRVQQDADLLWQVLVRETYILIQHYKTKQQLQEAFENIKVTKSKPKPSDIEKCKIFTDFASNEEGWSKYIHYCQSSYINILEAGYILNETNEIGYIFVLDFNKGSVIYYRKDIDGLRAIAIISVILFHLGYLPNGYLGVDVFFVICVFLITGVIYKEIDNKNFRIINFYESRIRRIVPLLLFTTITTFLFGILFMIPDDLENLCQSIFATNLFIINY